MLFRVLVPVMLAVAVSAQEREPGKLSPYYPTPEIVVEKMLQMGGLKRGEKTIDIGSGDGRIVIAAALDFGAHAEGVELDPALWKQSVEKIRALGLQRVARIIQGDALVQDYSSANLITIYLLPVFNSKLRPIFERQLRKGTRIVAHDFEVAGWRPEKTTVIDDGDGMAHTLYLYIR